MGSNTSTNSKTIETTYTGIYKDVERNRSTTRGLHDEIIQNGDELIRYIEERGYNRDDEICTRLAYTKSKELRDLLPLTTLRNVEYNIGILPTEDEKSQAGLERDVRKVCNNIVTFHLNKIRIIENIKNKIYICNVYDNLFNENLAEGFNEYSVPEDQRFRVNSELNQFYVKLSGYYRAMNAKIQEVRDARDFNTLNVLTIQTNALASQIESSCLSQKQILERYINISTFQNPSIQSQSGTQVVTQTITETPTTETVVTEQKNS